MVGVGVAVAVVVGVGVVVVVGVAVVVGGWQMRGIDTETWIRVDVDGPDHRLWSDLSRPTYTSYAHAALVPPSGPTDRIVRMTGRGTDRQVSEVAGMPTRDPRGGPWAWISMFELREEAAGNRLRPGPRRSYDENDDDPSAGRR